MTSALGLGFDLDFDLATTAFLFMDLQEVVIARVIRGGASAAAAGDGAGVADALIACAAEVQAAARAAGAFVIHVVVGFRPGYPEASDRNRVVMTLKQSGLLVVGAPDSEIHPALAPGDGEPTVVKHRANAFAGTDLEMLLRARNVDTLVLCGIATSGVVLSTVRHAADADYRIFVVEDACADADPEVHRVLTTKVFPRQATVTTTPAMVAALRRLQLDGGEGPA